MTPQRYAHILLHHIIGAPWSLTLKEEGGRRKESTFPQKKSWIVHNLFFLLREKESYCAQLPFFFCGDKERKKKKSTSAAMFHVGAPSFVSLAHSKWCRQGGVTKVACSIGVSPKSGGIEGGMIIMQDGTVSWSRSGRSGSSGGCRGGSNSCGCGCGCRN